MGNGQKSLTNVSSKSVQIVVPCLPSMYIAQLIHNRCFWSVLQTQYARCPSSLCPTDSQPPTPTSLPGSLSTSSSSCSPRYPFAFDGWASTRLLLSSSWHPLTFLFHITFSFFRIIAPSFFNLWLQCILRVCWDQSTIWMRHQRAIFWLPVSYSRRIDIRFWFVRNLNLEAGAASRPVRPMDGVALSVFLNGVLFAS